ncbi:MAG: bifunctional demethylmenaquinone methyltransferase/2-methoxy-6-polyprenyl-1,4-benzoquinol methylase UbiE [bacterium]
MSEQVRDMFAEIADTYDSTNSVLSLGIHHLWRKKTVRESGAKAGDHVLDCATGTGDLALEFRRTVGAQGRVVGTDFCKEMLDFAPPKAAAAGFPDVEWEVQDAMNLTYADDTFDIASISFGIRNVDDPVQGVRSMARVVKPGGKLMILEFGQPTGIMKPLFTVYSKVVIPTVGGLISGNKDAYNYLNNTSAAFPCREAFVELMREAANFSDVRYHTLSGGIAYLYVGTVAQ